MGSIPEDLVIAKARATLYQQIRSYFADQSVCEVEVPILGRGAPQDTHLDSIEVDIGGATRYLQTSPEFFMKRLLSRGIGDIFAITKSFRGEEVGARHNPEFSMLEWYRLGFSLDQLVDDVIRLLRRIGVDDKVNRTTYAETFAAAIGINPHSASDAELSALADRLGIVGKLDRAETLDFLMVTAVEPSFSEGLWVVCEYPECQAELAQLRRGSDGTTTAERFEVYLNGLELANGYKELTDPIEQRGRFEKSRQLRRENNLAEPAMDQRFLESLDEGLPDCAGVALGLDRLLMATAGKSKLADVLHFDWLTL